MFLTNARVLEELTKTRIALADLKTGDVKTRSTLNSIQDKLDDLLEKDEEVELPEHDFPTWAHGKAWGSMKYTQNLTPEDHGQVIALPYTVTRRMGDQAILHNLGYVSAMHPMKGNGIGVTVLTRSGSPSTYEVPQLTTRYPVYYEVTRV